MIPKHIRDLAAAIADQAQAIADENLVAFDTTPLVLTVAAKRLLDNADTLLAWAKLATA